MGYQRGNAHTLRPEILGMRKMQASAGAALDTPASRCFVSLPDRIAEKLQAGVALAC
jgi:hypothetical protein